MRIRIGKSFSIGGVRFTLGEAHFKNRRRSRRPPESRSGCLVLGVFALAAICFWTAFWTIKSDTQNPATKPDTIDSQFTGEPAADELQAEDDAESSAVKPGGQPTAELH